MIKRYDVMFAKENNGKTFWNKCGVAWLNKAETGYNLVLDAIPAPVDGAYRMNLFEPKENNNSNSGGNSPSSSRPGANRQQTDDSGMEDDIPF